MNRPSFDSCYFDGDHVPPGTYLHYARDGGARATRVRVGAASSATPGIDGGVLVREAPTALGAAPASIYGDRVRRYLRTHQPGAVAWRRPSPR